MLLKISFVSGVNPERQINMGYLFFRVRVNMDDICDEIVEYVALHPDGVSIETPILSISTDVIHYCLPFLASRLDISDGKLLPSKELTCKTIDCYDDSLIPVLCCIYRAGPVGIQQSELASTFALDPVCSFFTISALSFILSSD